MWTSNELWIGAILGAILGAVIVPGARWLLAALQDWWLRSRPSRQLLQGICSNRELCRVFVRDLFLPEDGKLLAVEPRVGIGEVPNVHELWSDVEGRGVADFFVVLGQVGKTQNLEIVRASQDVGQWDCHVVLFGAQSIKAADFYRLMESVSFEMDGERIIDRHTGRVIPREAGYGYGVIQKVRNPYCAEGNGIGIQVGGFGVLGTAAAARYFRQHFRDLGREFESGCFGILVRVPMTAGEEAVERLPEWDRSF